MEYCAICGTELQPNEDTVCNDCELSADQPKLVEMSDEDFMSQINIGAMQ